jgi:hypothetical protein
MDGPVTQSVGGMISTERERILAAVGWQSDDRRRRVLRELLAEETERIYLYGYAGSRNRAGAIERTRRILLSAARTIDVIPEGCPLSVWCFFLLEEEREKPAEGEDLWRILLLATSEANRPPAEIEGDRARSRLAEHPQVRTLVTLYQRYLSSPGDQELIARSTWPVAREDVRCFLEAQFGEGECESRVRGPGLRRFLPSGAGRPSRLLALIVGAVVLALLVVLLRTWGGLNPRARLASEAWNGGVPTGAGEPAHKPSTPPLQAPPAGPAPPQIAGTAAIHEGRLGFQWGAAGEAEQYRLYLLTAKLDTLSMIGGLHETSYGINVREIPGLQTPGSYLFRVDAMSRDRLVASTGFVPFELP